MKPFYKVVTATPTLANAGAYLANDQVGAVTKLANIMADSGGRALLKSITFQDLDYNGLAFELWFFGTEPTTVADNAAFSMTDANAAKALGVVFFSDPTNQNTYDDVNNGHAVISCVKSINLVLKAAAGSRDLWMVMVTRDTPTHTDGKLHFLLGLKY